VRRTLQLVLALVLACLPAAAESPQALLRVEPDGFDFGTVRQGRTLNKEFALRNDGTAEIEIAEIATDCGCAVAELGRKRLAPGDSVALRVTLQTRDASGRIERHVLIRSNVAGEPVYTLRLLATVVTAR
jgi:hypothetical protein